MSLVKYEDVRGFIEGPESTRKKDWRSGVFLTKYATLKKAVEVIYANEPVTREFLFSELSIGSMYRKQLIRDLRVTGLFSLNGKISIRGNYRETVFGGGVDRGAMRIVGMTANHFSEMRNMEIELYRDAKKYLKSVNDGSYQQFIGTAAKTYMDIFVEKPVGKDLSNAKLEFGNGIDEALRIMEGGKSSKESGSTDIDALIEMNKMFVKAIQEYGYEQVEKVLHSLNPQEKK